MEQNELDELQKLINKYFSNKKITTIPQQKKGNNKSINMEQQQNQTVVTSGLGKLSVRDLAQGAIMAGLGAAGSIILPLLESGELDFDFNRMWKLAIGVAGAHLIRKLISPQVMVITNPPQQMVQAVKAGETIEVTTPESSSRVMELDTENKKTNI